MLRDFMEQMDLDNIKLMLSDIDEFDHVDAATYFETGNINDLTDKINASLDAKVASEAAEKGPIWASKFTWDHVAEKTSIFYRSILG